MTWRDRLRLWRDRRAPSWFAIACAALVVFFVDVFLLRGITGGVLYLPVLWVAFQSRTPFRIVAVAVLCTLLIVVDFVLSPTINGVAPMLINRILTVAIVWLLALLFLRITSAEGELSQREAYGRIIVESALDAVISMNAAGKVVGWNAQASEYFGYRASETHGRSLAELIIPPEFRAAHSAGLTRFLKTGEGPILGKRLHLTALRRDGSTFPVELSVNVARVAGEPIFHAFLRDISEQVSTLAQLDASQQKFRLLLESTAEAIYGIDLAGKCTFCNPACLRMLGYDSLDDVLGKSMHELMHYRRADGTPYDVEECPIYSALRDNAESHIDNEVFWRKDGTNFPVEYWSYPIVDNGVTTGAVVTFFDITEKKADAEHRARLAAIVDSSYDAIIGRDLMGTIAAWNSGAQLVYGYAAEEAIGRNISLILAPGQSAEEPEIVEARRNGARLDQFETTRCRKDGREIPVSITVSPIVDASGRLVGSSTIERDITQQQNYEAELTREKERAERAQRQAEAALRVRSEFLANVSHELRTPMNSILGMLQLARDEELSPTLRDYVETAHGSAASLLDLLNDILDFSRLELGKFTIDEAPFNLRATIDEAVKSVSPAAFGKGLELVCDIAPETPDALIGDEVRLRQIVLNLVGNAVKFTETGEIVVSVSVVRLWPGEARLKFSVRDTGMGIASRDQERIFEAFAQADASTTRRHGGVGLGLAICNELLRRMGSRLTLKSELGRGSEFSFLISFPRPPGNSAAPMPLRFEQLRGLPVLVVDDNETNRRILEHTLRSWKLEPVLASDAEQGLALLRDASREGQPFPLALIDALMPGMDGLTLSEAIRNDQDICRPPIVLMISSADRQAFAQRTDELQVSAFLTKPVSQSDLLDALMQCLEIAPPEVPQPPMAAGRSKLRPLAVLLVEDTPANQKVVSSVLSKRGHMVTVAQNGREAVNLVQSGNFDVILMDVQMPIMDGFQATAAIRSIENGSPQPTPIIAMTAHAMRGDREKCLAAGMDAYLAKPIDVQELLAMVEGVRRDESGDTKAELKKAAGLATAAQPGVVDIEAAMQRLAGDMDLLRELATMFAEDAPQLLEKLEQGINERDASQVRRAAHSLKGLAANFGAARCVSVAQELELLGKQGTLDPAPPALATLRECLVELDAALLPYRGSAS
jgi:PAS domain S-box-containing protein